MGRAGGGPESRIYAGLKPGTTADDLRQALANRTVADHLASFTPKVRRRRLPPSRDRSLAGRRLVVFEVQENSDVTFRLYDWDHVDAKTGKPRPLQVDQAIACIDFAQGRDRSGGAGGGGDDAGAARATLSL